MRKRLGWGLAGLALATAAGCGSSATTTRTPAMASTAAPSASAATAKYGKQYLALIAPANHWPANALDDIKATERDDEELITALRGVGVTNNMTYTAQIAIAGAKISGASNAVRSDLGLPPNS